MILNADEKREYDYQLELMTKAWGYAIPSYLLETKALEIVLRRRDNGDNDACSD